MGPHDTPLPAPLVGDLDEDTLIARFFAPLAGDLRDDTAAVTVPSGEHLLVSSDALLQDVHFTAHAPAALTAYKALTVNVSDILASGGVPRWYTLALSMPKSLSLAWPEAFARGLREAADAHRVQLIGGDTTAAIDRIGMALTIMGHVPISERIGRDGGRPGHLLAVTGVIGDAGLGLDILLERRACAPDVRTAWLRRHFCPPLHPVFAREAARAHLVSAMMDLSDGPVRDLPRLCRTSGTGAEVDLDRVPMSPEAAAMGLTAEAAVRSGEDYQLLCAVPPAQLPALQDLARHTHTPLQVIGRLTAGADIVWRQGNRKVSVGPPTWSHFN